MSIHKGNLLLIGISHKTAPVEIREKFSFTGDALISVLSEIKRMSSIRECLVLSTCNRTEIYAVAGDSFRETRRNIENYILDISGIDKSFLRYFYCLNGTDVIEHLFQVICGFDSMIFGESQIFGQVKSAFSLACDNNCTGPIINRLFHQAFQVSKQVRTNCTFGSEGAISASSAAVALARKTYGSLQNRTVLLVGAGKIGRMCARLLIDSGIKKLYLANRTAERADALVEELSGEAIPFEKMDEMFGKVDIIITSASSSNPIITKSRLIECIGHRDGAILTLIDLGVPRNIDPEVASIGNIILYNIDNLKDVTGENYNGRNSEEIKAREIIKLKVDEYDTWLQEREILPEIRTLREKCENIRTEELGKIKNKVNAEIYDAVDLVTRRIVRKILHNPTVTLRASESGETRKRLVESLNALFSETYERSNRKLFHENSIKLGA
ncbi:MAG: glutamyl-tRNA reductase [Candidatus Latescibacter sp.]|nr:glutamyl-tRNA reductase [Candidatus Latescibacter sp.]